MAVTANKTVENIDIVNNEDENKDIEFTKTEDTFVKKTLVL